MAWEMIHLNEVGKVPISNGHIAVFLIEGEMLGDRKALSAKAAHAILHAVTGLPSLRIDKDPLGKPIIQGRDIYLSISHSHNVFIIAVGSIDLGIDIEFLRHRTRWVGLYEWINAPKDRKSKPIADDFLRCWTAKESIVKLLGEGLSYGLDRISLPPNVVPEKTDHQLYNSIKLNDEVILYQYLPQWQKMTSCLATFQPSDVHTFTIADYCHD